MGWCGVSKWKDMLRIWKEFDKAKTGEDLHFVLSQHWAKHQGDLNVQFYDIFWCKHIASSF